MFSANSVCMTIGAGCRPPIPRSSGLRYEPPRILWRLQLLREWSHEQEGNQVFPGSPRARSAPGARAA
ncbi:hypothetical protein DF058_34435 [Burkholderia cenocepacia]|nr:hypothetical protein DF058_34435 [Burkholderia cenocepacia]RRA03230.1 hypothetical protein DF059_34590 [Burkholderia cenocepacia]